jgi:hypothetical protein
MDAGRDVVSDAVAVVVRVAVPPLVTLLVRCL